MIGQQLHMPSWEKQLVEFKISKHYLLVGDNMG